MPEDRRRRNAGWSEARHARPSKRIEPPPILNPAPASPTLAIMDETDSGLDIDALKVVAHGVNTLHREHGEMSILLITHYQRLLNYIAPDFVHVMVNGRIVKSGGPELAHQLEAEGYEVYKEAEVGANADQ